MIYSTFFFFFFSIIVYEVYKDYFALNIFIQYTDFKNYHLIINETTIFIYQLYQLTSSLLSNSKFKFLSLESKRYKPLLEEQAKWGPPTWPRNTFCKDHLEESMTICTTLNQQWITTVHPKIIFCHYLLNFMLSAFWELEKIFVKFLLNSSSASNDFEMT